MTLKSQIANSATAITEQAVTRLQTINGRYPGIKLSARSRVAPAWRFPEYEGDRGLGVVRGVRDDPKYVKVLFDDGHISDCHPGSVEVVG